MRYVWTLDEVLAYPEFGTGSGWFYGLVRDDCGLRLHLCEIFGGTGYAYAPPRWHSPREWWMAAVDVWSTPRRKEWGQSNATNGPRRLNTDLPRASNQDDAPASSPKEDA